MISKKLEEMTLREKIGQLIVTGFPGACITEEYAALVREYKVANTIFFSYNCINEEQIRSLSAAVRKLVMEETGTYPLISIDQEGGAVARLPEDSIHIPGVMALGAIAGLEEENAYKAALYTGQKLKELGINFNLAPVMDMNSNPDNPVIGVRSFGSNPSAVSKYGCAMVRGYLDAGILCSVKHFPGHGDTSVDSHLSLPTVDKSYEALKQTELIPFQEAIKAGTTAVTLAHILFPQIEKGQLPATMSPFIVGNILRGDLGFEGLVISDCMEMNAIKEYFGTEQGAVKAIQAGVDLVFISHTARTAAKAVCLIEEAVKSGELSIKRIDESVKRILKWKQISEELPCFECSESENARRKAFCQELMVRSVHFVNREPNHRFVLGQNPVFLSCGAYRSTLASSSVDESLHFATYFGSKYQADSMNFSVQPEKQEIQKLVDQIQKNAYSAVVIATYNGHLNSGQIVLAQNIFRLGIPMVMVALRNPYDLDYMDDTVDKIAAYEYSEKSFLAIGHLLIK